MMSFIKKIRSVFYQKSVDADVEEFIRAEIERRVVEVLKNSDTNPLPATTKLTLRGSSSRRVIPILPEKGRGLTVRKSVKDSGDRYTRTTDFFSVRQEVKPLSGNSNLTIVTTPYDYEKIDKFHRVESYFSRSIGRQVETLLRNGYYIVSEEQVYGKAVREVITLYQTKTKHSFTNSLSRIASDLLKYGFFVLVKEWKSVGNVKQLSFLRPISPRDMMFVVDSSTYRIQYVYEQNYTGLLTPQKKSTEGMIPVENCIIGFFTDAGKDVYPEPPCLQIIDDILTLRSLEESVEILSFQYSSPLLHAKVGTPEEPCRRGETAAVANAIAAMAPNGVITTDHRVSITSVTLQSAVSNLMPYIEHFKDRIFIGSGTSGVIVGEGDTANRATSESHDNSLADRCAYIGSIIESALTYQLICDILTNIGVSPVDPVGDPLVTFEFNEMTLGRMIEKANNTLNLYHGNIVSHAEARKMIKRPPMTEEDRLDTYLNRVQIPLAKAKGSPTDWEINPTLNQPQNQYGKKSAPGSRKD